MPEPGPRQPLPSVTAYFSYLLPANDYPRLLALTLAPPHRRAAGASLQPGCTVGHIKRHAEERAVLCGPPGEGTVSVSVIECDSELQEFESLGGDSRQ